MTEAEESEVKAPEALGNETPAPEREPVLIDSDLLIEDVSIDGMCGVY